MKLEDIKTKEEAAYYLIQAQRRLAASQDDCQALERRLIQLERETPEEEPAQESA